MPRAFFPFTNPQSAQFQNGTVPDALMIGIKGRHPGPFFLVNWNHTLDVALHRFNSFLIRNIPNFVVSVYYFLPAVSLLNSSVSFSAHSGSFTATVCSVCAKWRRGTIVPLLYFPRSLLGSGKSFPRRRRCFHIC